MQYCDDSAMNEHDFTGTVAGRVRWVYNRRYCYFRPNPLPFALKVSTRARRTLRSTLMSLCRLDGMMIRSTEREREIMSNIFVLREAVASISIDGRRLPVDAVLMDMADGGRKGYAAEAEGYANAIIYAFTDSSGSRKITSFTMSEMHRRLIDADHSDISPGEVRSEQSMVGRDGSTLESARFVPADPQSVHSLYENVMKYVNTSADSPMQKAAIAHYQFEAVHPFPEGNGAMGRLLLLFLMFSEGMLTYPAISVSEYLLDHKRAYFQSLYNVSSKDDFEDWFMFTTEAVDEQIAVSEGLISDVLGLRERMLSRETNPNRRATVEMMFDNPYFSVADVMRATGMTRQGSLKLLASMETEGLVEEVSGRERNRIYLCRSVRDAAFR